MRRKTDEVKEKTITRTFVKKYVYNVYDFTGEPTLLCEREFDDVPNRTVEKELADEYNVDKIALQLIRTEEVTMEMPVKQFMELATVVEKN